MESLPIYAPRCVVLLRNYLHMHVFFFQCPPNCFCRIIVGVPNGTPSQAVVEQPGYVMVCSLTPTDSEGRCMPLRGTDTGDDQRLYDTTGELANE